MRALFLYTALVIIDLIVAIVLFTVAYMNRRASKSSLAVGCILGGVSLLNMLAIMGGIL